MKNSDIIMYNVDKYIREKLNVEAELFANGAKCRTGYKNIDMITSLYPGLYVIGAISSLGKTTFMHQMADQIIKDNKNVMFFSLEQSALELTSKSLSRIMAMENMDYAMTSLQVRKNINDTRVYKAKEKYLAHAKNMCVYECEFSATIDDIEEKVNNAVQAKYTPLIIIDYLQVIKSDNCKSNMRDAIDDIIKRLKRLQSKNKLVMFVISSLNRQNYQVQIDFESFKETGGIEYTADVIWGLQLGVINDNLFDETGKINEKRKAIINAKSQVPRKIELVCLKNRFGVSSYKCAFDYYPQFDLFVPCTTSEDEINKFVQGDKDGFYKLSDELYKEVIPENWLKREDYKKKDVIRI